MILMELRLSLTLQLQYKSRQEQHSVRYDKMKFTIALVRKAEETENINDFQIVYRIHDDKELMR